MKGLIFDIDGTLWDASKILARTYNEAARRFGLKQTAPLTETDIQKNLGKTTTEFVKSMFPTLDSQDLEACSNICFSLTEEFLRAAPPSLYPGVAETLKKLSKTHPLYIVSNCQCGYIELLTEVSGIGHLIQDSLCNGDTGLSKGHNIRTLVERNQLSEAVYIGDTLGDYEACQFAGVSFVWASYGFGHVPQAQIKIQNFSELLNLF